MNSSLFLVFALSIFFAYSLGTSGPYHVHVSLTKPGHMSVTWLTELETSTNLVQFGVKPGEYLKELEASVNQKLEYGPGFLHVSYLNNLSRATRYYYRVSSDGVWSAEFFFQTHREDDDVEPVTILAYGDMGSPARFPSSSVTINRIVQHEVKSADFVLHVGDLAYDFQNWTNLDRWFEAMQPIGAFVPYMVSPGNRDNYTMVSERFMKALLPIAPSNNALYYSFDYQFVHVISLSYMDDYSSSSVQTSWLEQDLIETSLKIKSDNHPVKWILAISHAPMYSSSDGHKGGNEKVRSSWEALFKKYGVTLAIFGDDHGYERSFPVFDHQVDLSSASTFNGIENFVNPSAPIHILSGTGGIHLDGWLPGDKPAWSAYREAIHGYTKIKISKNSCHVTFIRAIDGTVADEFFIEKVADNILTSPLFLGAIGFPVVAFAIFFILKYKAVKNSASRKVRVDD